MQLVFKKVAAGILAAISLVGISQTATASAIEEILKAGIIRVAVPQDFPPFGSLGPDGKPQGYDVDMAYLVAKGLGVKVELVPVKSSDRIPYLTEKKVDLIISSLGKNPEREALIDFSIAYAPFFSAIFGPDDVHVFRANDLAGKTSGVPRDALEDKELTKIAPPTAVIKRFDDNKATIAAFLSGDVQLIVTGNTIAAAILASNPPRKPKLKFLVKNSPCYIGFNKGEIGLRNRVNGVIIKGAQNGSLHELDLKWLGGMRPDNAK